jgi:SLT domain-containing protein
MSNNTKIFSEAIAEAKAIRETAMANAKLALEEAFAPRIQEMMSDKLEAMSQEEDEMKEDYGQAEMDAMNDEISLEELLAELEGLEEGKEEMEEGKEEMEEGKEEMDENTIAEAEDDDEVGTISVDELKDIIRDIMADVMGGGEEEEEAGEEEMEAGEEEMEAGEDDLELEEILAEIANLEEGDEEEMEEGIGSAIKGAAQKVGKGLEKAYDAVANAKPLPGMDRLEKSIDKGSAALKKAGFLDTPITKGQRAFEGEENLEEGFEEWLDKVSAQMDQFGKNNPAIQAIEKAVASAQEKAKKAGLTGTGMTKGHRVFEESEELEETKELEEAMNTIATLRSELNEVNLLNAKLLYVNKLFKAKNLNEAQKVKVINAFDRAETVREAKNVFDTLNESLNTEKAKSQIKESLSFASKASGVSDRQPIMEGNDFVNRMQKLAGII